jgi:hypothetical protein
MAIEHVNISDAERHEPKGASTAAENTVYISDGATSGAWETLNPMGSWYYSDIGTGTTYTTPTSYTLMGMATTAGMVNDFTHNSLGRLTYSGTPDRHVHMAFDVTFKHSTGSGQDCYFAIFKNGVEETGSNIVQAASSAGYQQVAFHWDSMATTDDYYEIYLKTASGNIVVHKAYTFIMGMPD